MKHQELTSLTITQAAEAIRQKVLSPVDLVHAELERIQKVDKKLNSFLTLLADESLEEARKAEKMISAGRYIGPLHGIPIGLKDLYYTKGVLTTAGSRVMEDFVPMEDATVVRKLRSAGAIIMGKLNMDEFARGGTNENPHFGVCRNPWNLDRVPGGSSGGSAAAISAGLVMGALGSDTGGSVRIPAALCGIVGLKPTYGRVSAYGVVPLSWTCDHVGPMTRTVADTVIMLQAIAGRDTKDLSTSAKNVPDYSKALRKTVKGLRIATLKEFSSLAVDDQVSRAFNEAVKVLQGLGVVIEEVSLPFIVYADTISDIVISAEAAAFHEPYLKRVPEKYGPRVRDRNELGFAIRAVSYIKAQRARTVLNQGLRDVFKKVDAIISPTCSIPAPEFGQSTYKVGSVEEPMLGALAKFTRLFNVTGSPAISVPCGFSSDGLPIALQIVGRAFDEAGLFTIAHAYESASDWHLRRPPV